MINRTKTSILSLVAAAVCMFSTPFQTQAQELTYSDRFYLSVSGGVAFGVTNGDQGGNFIGGAAPENLLSNNRGTLGSGVPLNLRLGMFVTDQISLDLGVQYFSGFRNDVQMVDLPQLGSAINAQAYTEQLRINPTVTFYAPITKSLDAYTRVGLMIPVAGAAFIEAEGPAMFIQPDPVLAPLSFERTEEIRGNFSLGYTAALGLEYNVNDRLALFVEAEALHLNVTRNTGEFTTLQFVGPDGNVVQDLREVAPASQLRTNYVDALGVNSNNALTNPNGFDPQQPLDLPTSTSFYHHISAQLGVKFRF